MYAKLSTTSLLECVNQCVIHPSTAPGPVQNLTVSFLSDSATYNDSNRTYYLPVSISWQPPQYPNGQIIAYSYQLVEINGRVLIEYTNTTGLSVEHNVTVSPFTNYTATVVTFTSASSGDTAIEMVTSPEAGKLVVFQIDTTF